MANVYQPRGFSLVELLIVIAIVGTLAAIALPAYRGYIDTANMTRTTANFEEAARMASALFTRRTSRLALGILDPLPDSSEAWIAMFNPDGRTAPGGGPAFIPSSKQQKGDADLGAIGVEWTSRAGNNNRGQGQGSGPPKDQLKLWRPAYITLEEKALIITNDGIKVGNVD